MAGGLDKAVKKTRKEVKRVFVRLGLSQPYHEEFFEGFADLSRSSAAVIAPMVVDLMRPASVVDVGCGLGFWLEAFAKAGVRDVQGFDGDYVKRDQMVIPAERFTPADLSLGRIAVERTFDLAMSVEVAEHLPATAADAFVESLTKLAPAVLFSAAIPQQGGTGHVNEQWPGYWAERFAACGFVAVDCIRPRVWNDERVAWWYAQNAVLYVNKDAVARFPRLQPWLDRQPAGSPLSLVHPRLFKSVAKRAGR